MSDFLIDEKYVKDNFNVSANMDSNTIKKSITQVNRIYIQELLGIALAEYLVATPSLTEVYAKMLPDIKMYFGLLTQYDLLSSLGIKTTNKSTALGSDSTTDIASIKLEMKFIEEKYTLLKADILAYLINNSSEITLYTTQVRNNTFNQIAFTPAYNNKIYGG
jgi:hypothetical protein